MNVQKISTEGTCILVLSHFYLKQIMVMLTRQDLAINVNGKIVCFFPFAAYHVLLAICTGGKKVACLIMRNGAEKKESVSR